MLMYVDMDFNLVQVLMFVVYQYMYIITILIIQTSCFSNIIKSLLAVFTYKKFHEM